MNPPGWEDWWARGGARRGGWSAPTPPAPPPPPPPRKTTLREVVEPRGVVADDFAPNVRREVPQLAGDVFARVRPHPVGMREVRPPHHLVHAELVEELHAYRVRLVRRPHLALPILARRHGEREI